MLYAPKFLISFIFCAFLFQLDNKSFAHDERKYDDSTLITAKIPSSKYFALSSSIPLLRIPWELGIGYTHFFPGNRWGIALDYKYGMAKMVTIPEDYYTVTAQNFFGENDLGKLKNVFEKIHSVSVRVCYQFPLSKKFIYAVETGPNYIIYDKAIPTPAHNFIYSNYEVYTQRIHTMGLSVVSKIHFPDNGWFSCHLFMHNNINAHFSYTALGLGLTLGNHKFVLK